MNEESYKEIKRIFSSMRKRINEEKEFTNKSSEEENGVPYTENDELLKNSKTTAKSQFGADFNSVKFPMLYYKQDGDITLSGNIPSLNDMKFQFRYKDPSGCGCYLWVDSLMLTDENIKRISRILGVFKNWKSDLEKSEDVKPMSLKNEY